MVPATHENAPSWVSMEHHSCLADYLIGDCLGQGSFGKVYKVLRLADRNHYVLKQVSVDGMSVAEQNDAANEVCIATFGSCFVLFLTSFI